ncbi:MAG TPA: molybdopterin molybdotransferase MoeA [Leptolyngbyaceae cyanobacterium M33_DOE_097]|uniref:Molybdopterin molybdenumtransferase n=1 Tax=Oscillatoriales cyanobacterium SpSt-418 TaxID=2282169 RepID=A0A7C3KF46_9CYAN|nr:molybdopterin molybdotransferase MoeA [Leptolyngbyaceae cyanobacterium M33_DOE_097]
MISAEQAEQTILQRVQPFQAETECEQVSLMDARDRILAHPITSPLDFPHWDNSAMDGYAVQYADVATCSTESPVTLTICEEIPAGKQPQVTVQPGQAARIFTGAVMPAGADTVVMQENTQRQGDRVTVLAAPKPKAFVRYRGDYYQAGQPLLPAGLPLRATELAVLAAVQCGQVPVLRQPRVAILSTGDELVEIDQPLQPGQIVDSNRYALAAAISHAGAIPVPLGIVPDRPDALKTAIATAIAEADVVLSSGGVSVGDYDYVDQILADLGAHIHFRAVAVKPGKPLTFATFTEKPVLYFGLPGNPASALLTFWRFVQPALRKLAGYPEQRWRSPLVTATTTQDLRSDGKRETYLWGHLAISNRSFEFRLAGGGHSSGNLINLAGTNGFAVLPIGVTSIAAGETVSVMQVASAF